MKLEELKIGTKVTYPFFNDITFDGMDSKHVILKDRYGNTKKVFKELFIKYGRVQK